MDSHKLQFNRAYYSVFGACQDFRQRLTDLQRLTKTTEQDSAEVDVIEHT